jgi:hypothetical protein
VKRWLLLHPRVTPNVWAAVWLFLVLLAVRLLRLVLLP